MKKDDEQMPVRESYWSLKTHTVKAEEKAMPDWGFAPSERGIDHGNKEQRSGSSQHSQCIP